MQVTLSIEIVSLTIAVLSPIIGFLLVPPFANFVKKKSTQAFLVVNLVFNLVIFTMVGYGFLSLLRWGINELLLKFNL